MSASDRIRYRLVHAAHRYHANDNIAAFIRKGELDELRGEVERKLQDVLHALVIDTENDHNTVDTARRVAKMFVNEVFSGRYEAAPSVTEFPNVSGLNDVMVVGPIKVRSACSHHLCPIIGRAWIGVLPSAQSNLIGLSRAGLTEPCDVAGFGVVERLVPCHLGGCFDNVGPRRRCGSR